MSGTEARKGSNGFRHEALIFGSDDELLEIAVPFLRGGVEAGDPTLLRLPAPQQAAVVDALDCDDGVTVLSYDPASTPLSLLRETHAAVARACGPDCGVVRMLGEIPQEPWPAWLFYEAAINRVFASLPAWGVCPYDTRRTPAAVLDDVERTHPLRATPDLLGAEMDAFGDPLSILEREARRPDPVEQSPPDLELVDPSPVMAGLAVSRVAHEVPLADDAREGLRLAVVAVVANAREHGQPPVRLRAWARADRIVATVTDRGNGPPDVLCGVLPDGSSADDSTALYHVREAVSDVALVTGPFGFTVRLVQRC